MIVLTRTDPPRRMHRFYVVEVTPTLFGEWQVMREWGRIGRPGTLRTWTFADQAEAEKAQQRSVSRKLRRGYSVKPHAADDARKAG